MSLQADALNQSIQPSIHDNLNCDISIVDNLKNDVLACTDNSQPTSFQKENDNDIVLYQRAEDSNSAKVCQSGNIQQADIPPNDITVDDDSNSNDISENLPKRIVKVLVDDLGYEALKRLGFKIVD